MPDFTFFLKKILLYLFYPTSLIFLFLFIVSIYVVLGERRGRRRFLLFIAILIYYFSSTPFLPYFLLKHLESKYTIPAPESFKKVNYVVVLTAGVYPQQNLLLEERLDRESYLRLIKALEIKKAYPEKKVLIIGGCFKNENNRLGATYYKKIAEKFGIDVQAIDEPLDTITSAKVLKKYIPNLKEPFFLLTSAYHLPRAMFLFKKEGFNPIPYPTNYDYKICKPKFSIWDFFPDPLYLEMTTIAVHEYLGLTFYKLKFLLKKIF